MDKLERCLSNREVPGLKRSVWIDRTDIPVGTVQQYRDVQLTGHKVCGTNVIGVTMRCQDRDWSGVRDGVDDPVRIRRGIDDRRSLCADARHDVGVVAKRSDFDLVDSNVFVLEVQSTQRRTPLVVSERSANSVVTSWALAAAAEARFLGLALNEGCHDDFERCHIGLSRLAERHCAVAVEEDPVGERATAKGFEDGGI